MFGSKRGMLVSLVSLLLLGSSAFADGGISIDKGGKKPAPGEPFGRIKVSRVLVMPEASGHSDWVTAIKNAQHSIRMMMFHITDRDVIDALIARANDPIDMRVIVDNKVTGGYKKAFDEMAKAGVKIRPGSSAFSITHGKSMVVDNKSAWITAINMTNTAQTSRDFGIVTPDKSIIVEMNKVFEADWLNADSDGNTTPSLTDNNLAWSPNNSLDQLTKLIDSATDTLDAEVENITSDDIINHFNSAVARGVEVRLIIPECSYGNADNNYQAVAKLKGVKVHVEPDGHSMAQPYMHSKMMVIDTKRVYVGSINYSFNSTLHARELGVIFLDEGTGSTLSSEFQTDWNRSQNPSKNPDCGGSTGSGGSSRKGAANYHALPVAS